METQVIVILTIVVLSCCMFKADGQKSDTPQTMSGIASYDMGTSSGGKAICPASDPYLCADGRHCCGFPNPVCCISAGYCCESGYYCSGGLQCSRNGSGSFRQAINFNICIITIAFVTLVRSLF